MNFMLTGNLTGGNSFSLIRSSHMKLLNLDVMIAGSKIKQLERWPQHRHWYKGHGAANF